MAQPIKAIGTVLLWVLIVVLGINALILAIGSFASIGLLISHFAFGWP